MTYYDRFNEGLDTSDRIVERRNALLEYIQSFIPDNLENVSTPEGHEGPEIRLEWVKVPDPRPWLEEPAEMEVQPILPVEWVDDGSGFASMPGVTSLELRGKLPSGDETLIGYMHLPVGETVYDPVLMVDMGEQNTQYVSWNSADAELWLTVAESALNAQPKE